MKTDDKAKQDELKKWEDLSESQFEADLSDVLSAGSGRRLLYHIIFRLAGAETLSYTGDENTYFREGRRDVGLSLMREAQVRCPEMYLQMLAEAVQSAANQARRTNG